MSTVINHQQSSHQQPEMLPHQQQQQQQQQQHGHKSHQGKQHRNQHRVKHSHDDVPQMTGFAKTAEAAEPQQQQPGLESQMKPLPVHSQVSEQHGGSSSEKLNSLDTYRGAGKLEGRRVLITGGDSGIGRATSILYAKEGAEAVSIVYLKQEQEDADETKRLVEKEGSTKCVLIPADLYRIEECERVVNDAAKLMSNGDRNDQRIDILINNASQQFVSKDFSEISADQIEHTFRTNILNYMHVTRAALKVMGRGGNIINTSSVTAYKGKGELVDYASTKGAMITFTRSLATQLAEKGIRVNAVAPGPIWTPLIPATFDREMIESFGQSVPLKRMGQPIECATCYVFLGSADSSYMTGQTLHPNGGTIVNS